MNCVNRWLVLVFTFVAMTSVARSSYDVQIVGGHEVTRGEIPFIVSLQDPRDGHFCGGSLIKKNWILTAAHCAEDSVFKDIVIGAHKQTELDSAEHIGVKRVITHPSFNYRTMDYDFALIELTQDSSFSPVAINTKEIQISDSDDEQNMVTAAGWGLQHENDFENSNVLKKVNIPLVSKEVCNIAYDDSLTDRMICAGYMKGGRDSCQSDSGGPLYKTDNQGNTLLIGVVSWGEGCGRRNFPGVYGNVSAIADWIEQTAK